MLTHKKQLVLSFLLSTPFFIPLNGQSLFDEMIEEMNEMQARFERRFNRINEELKKGIVGGIDLAVEHAAISITENKSAQCIDVIIAPLGIKEKTFDASMDQDTNILTVTTPAGIATLQIDRHIISAGFNHQIKHEQDNKNGGAKHQVMMSSYSQAAKNVSAEMALEETKIEYDQTTQKLTISIPFRKKTLTKIPITVKEAKEQMKSETNK